MARRIVDRVVALVFAAALVAACSAAAPAADPRAASQDQPTPAALQLAAPRSDDPVTATAGPVLPSPAAGLVEAAPATAPQATAPAGTLAAFDSFRTTSLAWGGSPDTLSVTALWSPTSTQSTMDAATRLRSAAQGFLAWLDAHPPRDCYRSVWQLFRDAARLVLDGADAYLAEIGRAHV